MTNKKELSGLFISDDKWQNALHAFRQTSCTTSHVRLFHNSPEQTRQLLDTLTCNASVTQLFIGDLESKSSDFLQGFLAHTTTLRDLTLQRVSCDESAMQRIGIGAQANSSLTALQLSGCDSKPGLCRLIEALACRSTRLQQLSLKQCHLDVQIATALASSPAARLDVSGCYITDRILHSMLQQPVMQPGSTTSVLASLQSLDLGSNNISSDGASSLSFLLSASSCLTRLVLAGNAALGDAGVAHIAHGLACSTSLRQLDLSSCSITAAGCTALAHGLSNSCSLEQLLLSSNSVGAAGLIALVTALQQNAAGMTSSLQQLSLEYNQIRGAELVASAAIAPVIAAPLQSLCVAHNSLGDAGFAWLAGAVAACPQLSELDITEAGISDAGTQHLIGLLSSHPQLTSLHCAKNTMHGPGGYRLCTSALQHPGLHSFKTDESRVMDLGLRARMAEASRVINERQLRAAAAVLHETPQVPATNFISAFRPASGCVESSSTTCDGQPEQLRGSFSKHRLERAQSNNDDDRLAKQQHRPDAMDSLPRGRSISASEDVHACTEDDAATRHAAAPACMDMAVPLPVVYESPVCEMLASHGSADSMQVSNQPHDVAACAADVRCSCSESDSDGGCSLTEGMASTCVSPPSHFEGHMRQRSRKGGPSAMSTVTSLPVPIDKPGVSCQRQESAGAAMPIAYITASYETGAWKCPPPQSEKVASSSARRSCDRASFDSYSRRFRALTVEQQALFDDF